MKPLKLLLGETFALETSSKPLWHQTLIKEWHAIVGNLANIMTLEKIQNTTLIIGLYEHSWAHELSALSNIIIKTINEYLGEPFVQKLHFRLAHQILRESKEIIIKKNKEFKNNSLTLSEQQALSSIVDKELRESLENFLNRCKQKNHFDRNKKS